MWEGALYICRLVSPPSDPPQHSNPTVKAPDSVKFVDIPSYLEMEGYAPSGVLPYDHKKFIGSYNADRFRMRFLEKGNFLHYDPDGPISLRLWQWEESIDELCRNSWNDYITSVMECAGSWERRHDVELDYKIPEVTKMAAGILAIDRDVFFAAFRCLYNQVLAPETYVSTLHFWDIGHALWRPKGIEYWFGRTWAEFVVEKNREYKAKLRHLDQYTDFLEQQNGGKR